MTEGTGKASVVTCLTYTLLPPCKQAAPNIERELPIKEDF